MLAGSTIHQSPKQLPTLWTERQFVEMRIIVSLCTCLTAWWRIHKYFRIWIQRWIQYPSWHLTLAHNWSNVGRLGQLAYGNLGMLQKTQRKIQSSKICIYPQIIACHNIYVYSSSIRDVTTKAAAKQQRQSSPDISFRLDPKWTICYFCSNLDVMWLEVF